MSKIPSGTVPVWPLGSIIVMGISIVAGLAALVTLSFDNLLIVIFTLILSLFALGMAGFFYWLLGQRKTPIGDLKVRVGDTILPFEAITSDGRPFQTDQIMGQRILLKFFRGGW
ncbi:MAG: hypothetical protein AAF702_49175 [Chloroflexota bacterium]